MKKPEIILEKPKEKSSIKDRLEDLEHELKEIVKDPETRRKISKSEKFNKFRKRQRKIDLPRGILAQAKKAYKKNKIVVILLRRDRVIQPMVTQMVNGMIFIDDTPHDCSIDFVFLWRGRFPAIVVPQWSLSPVGTEDYYKRVESGEKSEPATIILRAIEAKEQMQGGQKISGKALIWILIGGAALFYVLFTISK